MGMEDTPAGKTVTAEVPLAEMFGYATTVRSMSQGRATFTMEFAKYSEVPPNIADSDHRRINRIQLQIFSREPKPCPKRNSNATSRT